MAHIMRQLIITLGLMLSGVCCFNKKDHHGQSKHAGVTYQVTLDVFSGLEDPKWDIDHTSPFYARIEKAYKSVPSTPLGEHLGYHGFLVKTTETYGQKGSWTVGPGKNKELETMLLKSCCNTLRNEELETSSLQTCGCSLSRVVTDFVTRAINGIIHHQPRRPHHGPPIVNSTACTTRYEPHVWNVRGVIRRNNCYNYGTNRQTNTFAQPGRASGVRLNTSHINATLVYSLCVRDGLTRLNGPTPGNDCLMALVIWPGSDFHFYRLDDNGFWSHKPGRTAVIDTDHSRRRMNDIEAADHGPYTVFAGYLGVGTNININ
ncbi:hypothetical protein ACF0H5_021007 [Mactra antiquata]